MCDKKLIERLENKISVAKLLLFDAQTLIKFGALASDSCVTDIELQLDKSFDDYYTLLKTINNKIEEAVKVLDIVEY